MGIGCIVAVHWVFFYGSIKYSNASIGVACMATTSLFAAIIEPFVMGTKHKWYELVIGIIIVPAMILIAGFTPPDKMTGIWMGLVSALLAALFSILNKKVVEDSSPDPMSMTFVELGSGLVFLSFVLPVFMYVTGDMEVVPTTLSDIFYLLVLALLCTTFAYVLSLRSLKYVTAFTANLTINLEPVYGVILAWLILNENEELTPYFYIGVVIIIIAVFIHPFLVKRFEKEV